MPYLEPHGAGWRVCWREGGRIKKSATITSKVAAGAELRARGERQRLRRAPGHLVIPWSEVRTRWLQFLGEQGRTPAYVAQSGRELTANTAAWKTTEDATPAAMAALKLGPWRVAKACLRWARTYLGQSVDHAAIDRRPHRSVLPQEQDLLSDKTVGRLVLEAGKVGGLSGRVLAHLVSTYGHRPQSLAVLTVGAFEPGSTPRLALVVKSGDPKRHPILPATARLLAKLVEGRPADAPLLLSPNGKPWKSGGAASSWFWHQVGEGVGIQQLKCYAISRMLELGLDLKTIASITGHRTPAVLLRYARTNEARQLAALSALARKAPRKKRATQVLPRKAISH